MNIGHTVRVFRAEPVVSPVPDAPTVQEEETQPEPVAVERVEIATPAPAPVRIGG